MDLAPRLERLDGARLGFIANRKQNSGVFIEELATSIARRVTLGGSRTWVKPSPYRPLSKRMMTEIVAGCDALVVGPND